MLDKLIALTVSRRPIASVAALGAMSVLASVMLTACDAQAEHRPTRPMSPMSVMRALPAADGVAVPAPAVSESHRGSAALREHRDDADPSHAAIGSYRD